MNKETIIKKIKKLEDRKNDVINDHMLYLKKINKRIELLETQLHSFISINCCGQQFNTQMDYDKHLKSKSHRMATEKWMICKVCRNTFYGYSNEEYSKLSTQDKMKTEYHKHHYSCHYCSKCDERFYNHVTKNTHKCGYVDKPNVMNVDMEVNDTYDTYNDEISIDEDFDYSLLESLSNSQREQLQDFVENLDKGDYSITEITDDGLHYVIYETTKNCEGFIYQDEIVRFRIPTRDEDFHKDLNFNTR